MHAGVLECPPRCRSQDSPAQIPHQQTRPPTSHLHALKLVLALLHRGAPCMTCPGTGVDRPKPQPCGAANSPGLGDAGLELHLLGQPGTTPQQVQCRGESCVVGRGKAGAQNRARFELKPGATVSDAVLTDITLALSPPGSLSRVSVT